MPDLQSSDMCQTPS